MHGTNGEESSLSGLVFQSQDRLSMLLSGFLRCNIEGIIFCLYAAFVTTLLHHELDSLVLSCAVQALVFKVSLISIESGPENLSSHGR